MTGHLEVAQLLGGRRRVLLSAIAALHAEGRLSIGSRHTLTVSPTSTAPAPGLERVLWKVLANPRPPGTITAIASVDRALIDVRRSCRDGGLTRRWVPLRWGPATWTSSGRAVVAEARATVPEPAVGELVALSVAVHGFDAFVALAPRFAQESGIMEWSSGKGDWEDNGSNEAAAAHWGVGL